MNSDNDNVEDDKVDGVFVDGNKDEDARTDRDDDDDGDDARADGDVSDD